MASLLSEIFSENSVTVTLHETCEEDDDDELVCSACADLVIGCPSYIVEIDYQYIVYFGSKKKIKDRVYLHKSCAELPDEIQHPLHPQHPLTVRRPRTYGFICDGCRHVSFGLRYCCKECKFKLDIQCVSKNEGQTLKERVQRDTIYHPHKLQLVYFHSSMPTELFRKIVCCCCLKRCPDGRDPTYRCNICSDSKMFIHKSCLDRVPRQVQSPFHPEHPLLIQHVPHAWSKGPYAYSCAVCHYKIRGLALTCDECYIKCHVSCGSRKTRGLRLKLHRHDMHYVEKAKYLNICTICKADCGGAFYKCVECRVNVHMECIPLPEIVEHESHDHPLKLTHSVVTHRDDDEYRCDICEEEGNIKHHSYYCDECNYIAHIECVHSEHEDDTSPKIYCLDPRGKDKAEEETEDAEVKTNDADVENDDAEEGIDDAEEKTKDEVHDSQEDWETSSYGSSNTEHSFDGQESDKSDMDGSIINIKRRIEELALQLEAVANLDKRIENVKADMVQLVFQLGDLRKKLIKSRNY